VGPTAQVESDQVLASMGTTERERVLRHLERHQLDDLG